MGWKRACSFARSAFPAALLTLALAVACRDATHGQPVITSVTNPYIRATVGVSGTTDDVTPDVNNAGRFGIYEVATGQALLNMAASIFNQSYVTVRIDGGPPTPGEDADEQTVPGWDLIFGDVGSNALNAGTDDQKDDQGAWVVEPTVVSANHIRAVWTTLPGGNETVPIPVIQIELNLKLVHDVVLYEFTVTNRDTTSHTVALRFAADYSVAGATEAPIYTTSVGNVSTETSLTGLQVPTYWRVHSSTTDDTVGALLSLAGADVMSRPARVTFGNAGNATYPLWDFTPTAGQAIVDGGSSAYYLDALYSPQQSRTVKLVVGRLHSTIDFDAPMAVGVDGPLSLDYDPTKPAGEQITPDPFAVTAFAQNLTQITLTNLTATINLPAGLALAPGETLQKTANTLGPNAEATFSWQVEPTGTASGNLQYSVSFSASPGSIGKSVVRTIDIPALPDQNFPGGWQMVAFPYLFQDDSPAAALGLTPFSFDLVRWNQTTTQYQAVTRVIPGEGYWLRLNTETQVSLQNTTPVPTSSDFEIVLKPGWNQIGNPFLRAVSWADVRVLSTNPSDPDRFVPLTVAQASDAVHQWISPTLYWYDTNLRQYVWSQEANVAMQPFVGYWVLARKSGISLLIPPPTGRSAVVRQSQRSAALAGGWRTRLVASASGLEDGMNYIGQSATASDAADRFDVEKPPAATSGISLALVPAGRAALAQDVRAAAGRKEWTVQVTGTEANQEVTVSWPEVGSVPRTHELYVVEPGSGQRKPMRQTSSVRVRTGENRSARVTIISEPRTAAGALRFVNWNLAKSRSAASVSVNVTTNQEASISIRVLTAAGKPIRTLASRSTTGRSATIGWDYRDARGVSVPSGMYIIELRGATADGQTAAVPVPHVVTR